MSGNFMRNKLIVSFNCTDCGGQLHFSYEPRKDVKGKYDASGDPTGAEVCYAPNMWVEPCRHCIEKHTKPAKQLAEALENFKANV